MPAGGQPGGPGVDDRCAATHPLPGIQPVLPMRDAPVHVPGVAGGAVSVPGDFDPHGGDDGVRAVAGPGPADMDPAVAAVWGGCRRSSTSSAVFGAASSRVEGGAQPIIYHVLSVATDMSRDRGLASHPDGPCDAR